MVSVQAVIFRLTNEENHMIEKLNIYMTTQTGDDPDDEGDREQQDEDHNGSGHQQ